MLKLVLGFDMLAKEVYVPGTKNDDLIEQLEYLILEAEADVRTYKPSELSKAEKQEMIPLNGGEFYVQSGMKELVEEITTDDLLSKMSELSRKVLEEVLDDDYNDLTEEEIIYYFYNLDKIISELQSNILEFSQSEISRTFGDDLNDVSDSLMGALLSTII